MTLILILLLVQAYHKRDYFVSMPTRAMTKKGDGSMHTPRIDQCLPSMSLACAMMLMTKHADMLAMLSRIAPITNIQFLLILEGSAVKAKATTDGSIAAIRPTMPQFIFFSDILFLLRQDFN
ncbi:MAG: hypothetical protein A2751_04840 [Candidatus Doudnabacteria bacterium RIFCSPHIGHO2_01_FULL_46_14]|uniref:Uncharacterized protein n=1 Tax=Candidatus Doudnabacteria bacterium RIFCSPHIGHO2_01_FULL_46_14 TaxID=1817824 RepID=A0A1F5NNN1_9BACT|nr:MAG: hypothetical protein A2751_04840 [Candidatus Doudnabacteria bacterium RIFCSPHIGHO2_01_FULL_46_14]